MTQMLAGIAFLLAASMVAGGLMLLHRSRQEGAGLLRAAALVLLIVGAGAAIYTTSFWIYDQGQGGFQRTGMAASMPGAMHPGGGSMMRGGAGFAMRPPARDPASGR